MTTPGDSRRRHLLHRIRQRRATLAPAADQGIPDVLGYDIDVAKLPYCHFRARSLAKQRLRERLSTPTRMLKVVR